MANSGPGVAVGTRGEVASEGASPKRRGMAHVLISRSCANRCVFCAVSGKRRRHAFPEPETIEAFISDCAGSGVAHLVFSGLGEPTMDPNLERYLVLAGGLGFETIRLFTNGYQLTPERAAGFRRLGVTDVLLSLHGMEVGHDRNVGRRGSFDEAVRALQIYAAAGIGVAVNTCLTRHNLDEIVSLRALLVRFPVQAHTLSFPEWTGSVLESEDSQVTYEEVADRAHELLPSDNAVTRFDNIPVCLVRRRVDETSSAGAVEYLDGRGAITLSPRAGKRFLPACEEQRCPHLLVCSGFESLYVERLGWGSLPGRVASYLTEIAARRPPSGRREPVHRQPPLSAPCDLSLIIDTAVATSGLTELVAAGLEDHQRQVGRFTVEVLWQQSAVGAVPGARLEAAWSALRGRHQIAVRHVLVADVTRVDVVLAAALARHGVLLRTAVPVEDLGPPGADGFGGGWLDALLSIRGAGFSVELLLDPTRHPDDSIERIVALVSNLSGLWPGPLALRVVTLDEMASPIHPSALGKWTQGLSSVRRNWLRCGRRLPLLPLDPRPSALGTCSRGFNGASCLTIDRHGELFGGDLTVSLGSAAVRLGESWGPLLADSCECCQGLVPAAVARDQR